MRKYSIDTSTIRKRIIFDELPIKSFFKCGNCIGLKVSHRRASWVTGRPTAIEGPCYIHWCTKVIPLDCKGFTIPEGF